MPTYNGFEYTKHATATVITTIATGEGIMHNKVSFPGRLMLRVSSVMEPYTLGMLLNTDTI